MTTKVSEVRRLLFSLLVFGVTAGSQAQNKDHSPGNVRRLPAGIFESEERFQSGGASTNGLPLFTLALETNGTYRVECSMPEYVQGIDGGALFSYPGKESGTWRWDPQNREIVLKVSKSSHMSRWFPRVLKANERNFDRLEAINLPPQGPQSSRPLWLPLVPAFFNRTTR